MTFDCGLLILLNIRAYHRPSITLIFLCSLSSWSVFLVIVFFSDIKSAHTEAPAVSPELITLNSNNYVNIGGKPKHPDFPEIDVSSCGVTKGCYRTPSMCNNSQVLPWLHRDL